MVGLGRSPASAAAEAPGVLSSQGETEGPERQE